MAIDDLEGEAAAGIAQCILNWLYSQIEPILDALKAILMAMLLFIDAQVLALRALLAQYDILAMLEKASWDAVQAIIDAIRNQLTSFPEGPLRELCPEFYSMLTDPALQLFDTSVAALTIWRERYKNVLSYMDEVEGLLQHWETVRNELAALINLIDDAKYWAQIRAAEAIEGSV